MSEIDFKNINNLDNNFDVNPVNNETVDILGVFKEFSQFVDSDICDLEVCELTIFQNFKLINRNMPQFLNEVF